MKKYLNWMGVVSLAFLFSLTIGKTVSADNRLQDMRIEVELQEDGSAIVTEYRQMEMDEGTELYIVLDELQDSELLNFSVSGFKEVEEWDSDASQAEKAGKYGVVETGSGLELIWGIGDYGENSYEVTYTLSNLVRELEDGQALLWNFDTFSSIPAENLTLEIAGPEPFTEEVVRFWGFGFEGDIQLNDGTIVWEAAEEVDSSNDVTVLVQMPEGFLNTQVAVDMTLDEQREEAMEGATYNEDPSSDELGPVGISLITGAVLLLVGGTATGITYATKVNKAKKEAGAIRLEAPRVVENNGKIYDDIPFPEEEVTGIAYLLQGIYKGYFEDYFSAFLLKWADEERILMNTTGFEDSFEEEYETTIEILNYQAEREQHPESFSEMVHIIQETEGLAYETGLWVMLLDAADSTGFISEDRMKQWAKKHAKEVQEYATYLTDYSKDYLEKNGYITFGEIEVWGRKQEVVIATESGDELIDRLIQFDNYLGEVELEGFRDGKSNLSFVDLLFWSVLLYHREEITEQFEDLLADHDSYYVQNQYGYSYGYWYGMSGFRENWSNGLASGGFHSMDAAMNSGSSGSGGATSFGGGGGAGGGGGGGAR